MEFGERKGQVTIFIVIAIIVVAAVILFFVLTPEKTSTGELNTPTEVQSYRENIQNCVEEYADTGIKYIGLQGGYNNLPSNSIQTEHFSVAYGYNGKETLVRISEMENQISFFMEDILPLCVGLRDSGNLSVEESTPEVKTNINSNSVEMDVNYPLTIKEKNSSYRLEDFHIRKETPLGDMHQEAREIIGRKASSNYIDISYLSNSDYEVEIFPLENNRFVYSISENNLNKSPYTFNFGVRK